MSSQPSQYGPQGRREFEAGPFLLTHADYVPRLEFGSHFHERPCVSIVLEGLVEKKFQSGSYHLAAPSAVAMPAAEPHFAWTGRQGACVLMIEPESASEEHLATAKSIFERITELQDARLHAIAWNLRQEIIAPDAVTPLAVDGLVREFMATATRAHAHAHGARAPRWLRTTQEVLRERFADPWSVGQLAREAGVHPAHLARTFRTHCGMSLGTYVRRLRVEWAALQLRTTDAPVADIAAQAGFADQSHLTRMFRKHFGSSPGRYRTTNGRSR